jgi:AcrR family transcriptional regulator
MPAAVSKRTETDLLKQQIRDAAIQLFGTNGFHGTSIQEVAEKVGISKQLLLYHYPSKEKLREAALGVLTESWSILLPLLLDALTADPVRLDAILDELSEVLEKKQDLARLVMMELITRPFENTQAIDPSIYTWMATASEYVRRRQADGLISLKVDPEAWVVACGELLLTSAALLHLPLDKWPEGVSAEAWRKRRLREAVRILQASTHGT